MLGMVSISLQRGGTGTVARQNGEWYNGTLQGHDGTEQSYNVTVERCDGMVGWYGAQVRWYSEKYDETVRWYSAKVRW
jgi:hypothetical protein